MFLCVGLVALMVAADFAVKQWAASTLTMGESVPFIGQYVEFTLVHNRGAAFNSFEGMRWFLILLPAAIIAGAAVYIVAKRHTAHPVLLVSLSLVIAGGIGNIIDRIRLGYVVDMINIHILPVFNVADMCVVTGCILLAIYVLFLEGRTGEK